MGSPENHGATEAVLTFEDIKALAEYILALELERDASRADLKRIKAMLRPG